MGNIRIKRDIVSMLIIVAGGMLFAILAIISLTRGNAYSFACMTIIGVVLGATGIYALFDRRPQITITKSGLQIRSIGNNEIPWSAVVAAELKWLPRSGDFIDITLVDGRTHRFFAEGFEVSSAELLRIINQHIEVHGDGTENSS